MRLHSTDLMAIPTLPIEREVFNASDCNPPTR
jgi:hypothetical protein